VKITACYGIGGGGGGADTGENGFGRHFSCRLSVHSLQKIRDRFAAIAAIAIAKMGLRAKGGMVVVGKVQGLCEGV